MGEVVKGLNLTEQNLTEQVYPNLDKKFAWAKRQDDCNSRDTEIEINNNFLAKMSTEIVKYDSTDPVVLVKD